MRFLLFPFRLIGVVMVLSGAILFGLGYLFIHFLVKRKEVIPPMLALVLASCGSLPYTPVVIVPLSGLYGATNCDQNGNPIIMLDPDRRPTTLIHERQHLADIMIYPGGCPAFLKRYKEEPVFRVRMELRAYCAEARTGADIAEPLLRLAMTPGLPEDFHISNPCQEGGGHASSTGPPGLGDLSRP